ncbi:MAG: YbjQ family protein [Deltaproteobacteria bacterium]|nr:YbjQ family protein [Deltaproteobacteria bacterium]
MSDVLFFMTILALGYGVGTFVEKRHYRSIRKREKVFLHLPAVTMKDVDYPDEKIKSAELVFGSAVISIDYFKKFLAGLRNIFGGTVKSYESLIDRARREALLRMKEMAGDASVIVNVRIETATIGRKANRKGVGCLEAIAYGTALKLEK